jgi:predicted RNA polymerase sigma factor
LLQRITPTPVVALNRAVAVAMVHGPQAALDLLSSLEADARLAGNHRLEAARAHMLEMAGDNAAARSYYYQAARHTASLPERRYLEDRAAALVSDD